MAIAIQPIADIIMVRAPVSALLLGNRNSIGPVRIEKHSSIALVGNMRGQYKAELFQGLEFFELSLYQDPGNWPDIAGEIGFDCDDVRPSGRCSGNVGSSPTRCFEPWRRRRTPETETRRGSLPPFRQK